MIVVAACGSRSELLDTSDDDDAGFVSGDDGEARIESGSDSPIIDARAFDATAHDADETSDATIGDDGAADASDGAIEDSGTDASDSAIDDSGPDAAFDACAVRTLYVDAVNGHDSSDGSSPATPFQSITKAIAIAAADTCITTISVSPGTYDETNGETFPLHVPANVTLVGDETNKGAALGNPTFINGAGPATALLTATLYPSSGATIAGFEITAPPPTVDGSTFTPVEILLYAPMSDITLRNNTLAGSGTELFYGSIGVYTLGSLRNVIQGNVATGNNVGIYNGGGASSRVESNALTQNTYGFEADTLGADLGGGDGGSAGLNILSCNHQNIWLTASRQPAANNYWDHVPPTVTTNGSAADIYLSPFFTLTPPTTTGAMLATPNCP
jgi:parallel beta-helix repeat protein